MKFFENKTVLVTGGASFIGSHLVEDLVKHHANVRVADDLSSGKIENLQSVLNQIQFFHGDLKRWDFSAKVSRGCDIVFHLAAAHGGRGYIATHPANCSSNMALDNIVFETAVNNGVSRITYASSACVYPTDIQEEKTLLVEKMVSFTERGGAYADEEYGWSKLMGEMSLRAYHRQFGTKTSAVRIFTAFGPRENESHAIIALIAKALIRQSPFEIWGDGEQSRNFTYVKDIVTALMLACEKMDDGTAVNAGISEFISLNHAAQCILDIIDWFPPDGFKYLIERPVGVRHRAADTSVAAKMTGWKPAFTFAQGMSETIAWYLKNKKAAQVKSEIETLLMQR